VRGRAAVRLRNAPLQEQRNQVSTEHEDRCEGDNHQKDVVEFPWPIWTPIEGNGDNENEHATSEHEAGFGQSHVTNLILG
jgi:hypothetical protein